MFIIAHRRALRASAGSGSAWSDRKGGGRREGPGLDFECSPFRGGPIGVPLGDALGDLHVGALLDCNEQGGEVGDLVLDLLDGVWPVVDQDPAVLEPERNLFAVLHVVTGVVVPAVFPAWVSVMQVSRDQKRLSVAVQKLWKGSMNWRCSSCETRSKCSCVRDGARAGGLGNLLKCLEHCWVRIVGVLIGVPLCVGAVSRFSAVGSPRVRTLVEWVRVFIHQIGVDGYGLIGLWVFVQVGPDESN